MRATDLLGGEVVDERGIVQGRVHDLRVTRSGPGEPWCLDSLIVGPAALAHRLGYTTGEVAGPAVLRWAARRLSRRKSHVAWGDVLDVRDRRLLVAAEAEAPA